MSLQSIITQAWNMFGGAETFEVNISLGTKLRCIVALAGLVYFLKCK